MGLYGDGEVRAGRDYRQEFRCRRADGAICWLREEVQIETLAPGRWRAVGVCFDITEQKRLETELRERTGQLEEADRHKDTFLAMLAHELRSPLAALRNALLLLRPSPGADAGRERAQETADRQVRHIDRLIEDLLDISRIARGTIALRREALDLAALVRDVTEDQRNALEAAGLTLFVGLPPAPVAVSGDAERLAQVLRNLLQNAAKFTEAGGHVVVQVTCDAVGGQAALAVRDTGIGIEPALLPQIFDLFRQAEASGARAGGLGLGLAVVKGLVELHGGEVRVASDGPGHGTGVTVLLPLKKPLMGEALPAA